MDVQPLLQPWQRNRQCHYEFSSLQQIAQFIAATRIAFFPIKYEQLS